MSRSNALLILLAALALASCDIVEVGPAPTSAPISAAPTDAPLPEGPTITPTPAALDTPTAEPPIATIDAPTPAAPSPLTRRELPPAGVAVALGIETTPPADCDAVLGPNTARQLTPDLPIRTLGLCLLGFAPDQDITISLTRPDGAGRKEIVPPQDSGIRTWTWVRVPEDPPGSYNITVAQGDQSAALAFELRPLPQASLAPTSAPPGSAFQLSLTNLGPGQIIDVYLYRRDTCTRDGETRPCWTYATALTALQADVQGQVTAVIATRDDDPENSYMVAFAPALHEPLAFELRR